MGDAADDAYDMALEEVCRYGFPGEAHLPFPGKCPSGKPDCWNFEEEDLDG